MKTCRLRNQSGYALLLAVLAFMGLSGVVVVGFTQQARQDAEQERYLHNKRVLVEAKRALLQYAYNYPVISGGTGGPGRLPCADTDNDGSSNTTFGDCDDVGRFPWAEPALGLNDLRDADGQRLWYTVSSTFATNTSTIVNSDTSGTLTVRAPGGNVMYDGSNPDSLINYGIAAVIIAPGAAIDRNGTAQDRSTGIEDPFDTTADTEPGIINPVNYLDLVAGTEDNATVTQGGAVDGFVLGGNGYQVSDNVNDQFILVTAEEVSAIAERAVLEAYRAAIDDYQQTIWLAVVNDYRYPWMNAYADITDLNVYDVLPGNTVGRVPFLNYFTDHDSHTVITDLSVDYLLDFTGLSDTADPFDPTYISAFDGLFVGAQNLTIPRSNLSFKQETFDTSANLSTDDLGTLISDSDVIVTDGANIGDIADGTSGFSQQVYLWDGCASCPEPEDGWQLCELPATNITDCAKNPGTFAFEPFTAWTNHENIKIRIGYMEFRYFWDELAANGWQLCNAPATAETDCARDPTNTFFEPYTDWAVHADIQIRMVVLLHHMDARFQVGLTYLNNPPTINPPVAPTVGANARFQALLNPASQIDPVTGSLLTPGLEPVTDLAVDVASSFADPINFFNITVFCEEDRNVGTTFNTFWNSNPDAGSFYCTPTLNFTATLNQLDITADYYPELPLWVRLNNWNDSLLMAYAADYQPGSLSSPPDCGTTPPCLTVTDDYTGETNNKASLLVGAGRIPANVGDLLTIFEGENLTPLDDVFAAHPNDGDDAMLILDDT
ncbi:MAG: hypothetical protein OER98_02020 [Gammaproteobacteria bacterium]|nr:hypothetical protein [Gammaproteobacteria bacterium]